MLPINELLQNPDEQSRLVQSLDELLASREALMSQLVTAGDKEKLSCLQEEISSDMDWLKTELARVREAISNVGNVRQYTRIEDE